MPNQNRLLDRLQGGLIVSCQATPEHPLAAPEIIAKLAECAQLGGAVGVRINGVGDVQAVREKTNLPIIGLVKRSFSGSRPIITPGWDEAAELANAGADIIALEMTTEAPGDRLALITEISTKLDRPVMADVDCLAHGLAAWQAGAALVGTTLSGYTAMSQTDTAAPDLSLIAELTSRGVRTVAEGRFSNQSDITAALAAGAWAVVVGAAITDPVTLTKRLVPNPLFGGDLVSFPPAPEPAKPLEPSASAPPAQAPASPVPPVVQSIPVPSAPVPVPAPAYPAQPATVVPPGQGLFPQW